MVILIMPYLFLYAKEVYCFFKHDYEKSIKSIYYKGLYSLAYWFLGIIPFLIVKPDFDNLPDDKITFYPLVIILAIFIIDLILIILMKKKFKEMDKDSDEEFYLRDFLKGKISYIFVVLINISYLIDYLLIYITAFAVIYG